MLNFIRFLDSKILNFLALNRAPGATDFFLVVTYLGEWYVVAGVTILFSAFLWRAGQRYVLPLWISVAGSTVSTYAIKFLEDRQRPAGGVLLESTASFPSGHATAAVALFGFIIYFLWNNLKSDFWRKFFFVSGLILILLIGFSRLYLGVHYLSDVLGGFLVGAVWLGVSFIILHKQKSVV